MSRLKLKQFSLLSFQYAANYVKKHLIASLEAKIKLLKLLSHSRVSNRDKVLYYDNLTNRKPISRNLLKYIGMTEAEFLQVNPAGSVQAEPGSNKKRLPPRQDSLGGNREEKKKSVSPPGMKKQTIGYIMIKLVATTYFSFSPATIDTVQSG